MIKFYVIVIISVKGDTEMTNINYAKISSDNIKLLLLKHNMSVHQLAKKIGIAPSTLNDAFKSKKGIPIDTLIKIAYYFGITVNDLCAQNFAEKLGDETPSDFTLINKFNCLDDYGKKLVMLVIDKEIERIVESKQL